MAEPTRPVLRWHGGKWRLAPWIIQHLPPHRIYVEPFGGGASVLLRKDRAYAEVYNDLDAELVNLFSILRDPGTAAALERSIALTPYARDEFEVAYEACGDAIDRARRFLVCSHMGFGSAGAMLDSARGTGFRANSNRSGSTPAHDWMRMPPVIAATAQRFRGVVIENRPASLVIDRTDSEATLFYVDPPYLHETRSRENPYCAKHLYRHELDGGDHEALLGQLRSVAGMVVLSGYPSPLYDDALPDWRRITTKALADGAREREEVLWINPAAAAALDRRGMPLFAEASHG